MCRCDNSKADQLHELRLGEAALEDYYLRQQQRYVDEHVEAVNGVYVGLEDVGREACQEACAQDLRVKQALATDQEQCRFCAADCEHGEFEPV